MANPGSESSMGGVTIYNVNDNLPYWPVPPPGGSCDVPGIAEF